MNKLYWILLILMLATSGWFVFSGTEDSDHEHTDEHTVEHTTLTAKEPVRADGEFTISTSFYPLQFALERVAGDLAVVTNIGEGRDPHDFRPSTQDVLSLQQADLIVLQGAGLEPWGEDTTARLRADGIPVLVATAELTLREAVSGEHEQEHDENDDEQEHDEMHEEGGLHDEHEPEAENHEHEDEHDAAHEMHEHEEHEDEHGHDHGPSDPHTWLDPVLFSETVQHLTEAFVSLDPENTATYEANAAALELELAALDAEFKETLSSCSLNEVIVSHGAYGYLADRYNFTIHAIAGLSTQDSPSATTLANLRAEAAKGIGAILLEQNSVTEYGETLARETGLQTLVINPIAFDVAAGDNYLTLMRANLENIATALACNE